ncbi:MAG: aminotransferase class V-fold PLP-dependent enzyme, partial [Nocardioides sp.]|nr:aminotransferase class V-fold PLP-dependent enzyme [Nocardioides sp.]
LYESGTAMVAATKVSGRAWLKLTLLNPMATPEQVLGICARIVALGDELAHEEAVA